MTIAINLAESRSCGSSDGLSTGTMRPVLDGTAGSSGLCHVSVARVGADRQGGRPVERPGAGP